MIALDTNVLIYACDKADPRRQQIALDVISHTTDGVILWHSEDIPGGDVGGIPVRESIRVSTDVMNVSQRDGPST